MKYLSISSSALPVIHKNLFARNPPARVHLPTHLILLRQREGGEVQAFKTARVRHGKIPNMGEWMFIAQQLKFKELRLYHTERSDI